jgi:hypothetical protein
LESLRQSLDENFKETLEFAPTLRNDFKMRLGPQIVLVEAAMHKSRPEFNKNHPNLFRKIAKEVILIPTDMKSQLDHYLKISGKKSKLPGILKRCWKDAIERMSEYQVMKYKTTGSIINMVRLSHPRSSKNSIIKDLVTDTLQTNDELTWEVMRSAKKSWKDILLILGKKFPHMALLRNLRNIATELNGEEMTTVMEQLENGVAHGKQFPFRYYTAYKQFSSGNFGAEAEDDYGTKKSRHSRNKKPMKGDPSWKWMLWRKLQEKTTKNTIPPVEAKAEVTKEEKRSFTEGVAQIVIKGLEKCMRKAIENFPSLEGRVMCLSDNSGSAWGSFTSDYGSQTVANIGNLSSLITALSATGGGQVGVFGDRLEIYTPSKDRGILEQLDEINNLGKTVGSSTENGIWLWFKNAFSGAENGIWSLVKNTFSDQVKYKDVAHLFIYSDMQAGHGGLFGANQNEYKDFSCKERYIDVIKLIKHYREIVNPKINIFTVQTAGYDNSLVPEVLNRTAILSGWTGNEVAYATDMVKVWDQMEN